MEGDEHVQPPLYVPVSTVTYDSSRELSTDLCWESPVPPPRDHATHKVTSFARSAFGQQLFDMQQQLACVIEGQEALHVQVAEVHATMNAIVTDKGDGSSMVGARIRGRVAEDDQNMMTSSRGDNGNVSPQQRPAARSHAVLPFQRKLMKTRSDVCSSSFPGDASHPKFIGIDTDTSLTHMPSRNCFGGRRATQRDDMDMLFELFRIAEQDIEKSVAQPDQTRHAYIRYQPTRLGRHSAGIMIDSVFGTVIGLNAIFIGIRMDQSDAKNFVWTAIDMAFTGVFLVEIAFRVLTTGFCQHFCGPSRKQNIFDASLVFIDLMQQFIELAISGESDDFDVGPSASLFRIGRLGRLARMLHLLRLSIFTDLLTMLQGMLGGLATLGWSIVLFIVAIYIVSLFFREFFGNGHVPNVTEMFSSVPRSMFTTFRCSFGDCSSSRGVPIFEYVNAEYGGFASLLYCSFLFVITIGLFNVISAIFVESTMQAASALQTQKKKERLRDHILWCSNVNILIKRLVAIAEGEGKNDINLTERLQDVYLLEVPCSAIDELAQDPEAIAALSALDIPPEDRDFLSDILDPDQNGTINVIEIVEGLRMLRGDPRRSDMVTVNLMLRSVQRDLSELHRILEGGKEP